MVTARSNGIVKSEVDDDDDYGENDTKIMSITTMKMETTLKKTWQYEYGRKRHTISTYLFFHVQQRLHC